MDKKHYCIDTCPYCGGDLHEAGKSNSGNLILQCIECGKTILEEDIVTLQNEDKKKIKHKNFNNR